MFVRKLQVATITPIGELTPCPIKWIDNFAMRNFTNHAIFDDTLPIADGLLEAGFHVPIQVLHAAMEDWFRRKGYIKGNEALSIVERPRDVRWDVPEQAT